MRASRAFPLLAALLVAAAGAPARAAPNEPDAVAEAWRARAKLAASRALSPELDACDRGVEVAFRDARADGLENGRSRYILQIAVGDDTMLVGYQYAGTKLEAFWIVSLPGGWFAYQKTGGKTFTVLTDDVPRGCAFDLCMDDPTVVGPCPSKPAP